MAVAGKGAIILIAVTEIERQYSRYGRAALDVRHGTSQTLQRSF